MLKSYSFFDRKCLSVTLSVFLRARAYSLASFFLFVFFFFEKTVVRFLKALACEIDSLSVSIYTVMNNFDDDEGGGISGAEVLTGCAFNEEISKLAVSRTSSVLAASTWLSLIHI